MKWLSNIFASIRSLAGSFGLIYLLMALAVLGGILATIPTWEGSFSDMWLFIDALNGLQKDARYHLVEMDLSETRYFLSYLNEDTNEADLQSARQHYAAFVQSLDEVSVIVEDYSMVFFEDTLPWLEEIKASVESHQGSFEQLVGSMSASDEPDWVLYDQIILENEDLQAQLGQLVNDLDQGRVLASREVAFDVSFSVLLTSVGLILILILALWGYRTISALVQPLLSLTNATMAIGGEQYRPELLAGLKKKRTLTARLAAALDNLAFALQKRDADLQTEIQSLQQELYESRRRRLKIARPTDAKLRSGRPESGGKSEGLAYPGGAS